MNEIKGDYAFVKTGKGWTGEIEGLGVVAFNRKTKQTIDIDLGPVCLAIRPNVPSKLQSAQEASAVFVRSWNEMTDKVDNWLNDQGDRIVTRAELRMQVDYHFRATLNSNTQYTAITFGKCAGNIPVSPAIYKTWWDHILDRF